MSTFTTDRFGDRVAVIYRVEKGAAGYNKYQPWVLSYRQGRKERFALKAEAVAEAKKSWPGCTFSKT